MDLSKVLEACNSALKDKDFMLSVYIGENEKLRAENEQLRAEVERLNGVTVEG